MAARSFARDRLCGRYCNFCLHHPQRPKRGSAASHGAVTQLIPTKIIPKPKVSLFAMFTVIAALWTLFVAPFSVFAADGAAPVGTPAAPALSPLTALIPLVVPV